MRFDRPAFVPLHPAEGTLATITPAGGGIDTCGQRDVGTILAPFFQRPLHLPRRIVCVLLVEH